jgi:hypothetical protein
LHPKVIFSTPFRRIAIASLHRPSIFAGCRVSTERKSAQ